jgi:hypothetical protein
MRRLACLVALAGLLAMSGCGSDDEQDAVATATSTTPTETSGRSTTETVATETETETTKTESRTTAIETSPRSTSPEDSPGGAGDEAPARSLALFTAKDGRISPHTVRVPPFIAIRVELHSGDGADYVLSFRGKRLAVGGQIASTSSEFSGLKPNASLIGQPVAGVNSAVRVVASAEPGP